MGQRLDWERPERAGLRMEAECEPTGEAPKPSDSPGSPGAFSAECLQVAREALLNPRHQLRSAVALQIGQLNELSLLLTRFQNLVEAAGMEWAGWTERSLGAQAALSQGLQDLAEAKRQQEAGVLTLRQGLTAAKDEDTARLEAGLRNLASAAQELRIATETICGTGQRFSNQVTEGLTTLERSLPEVANRAGERLEESIAKFQGVLRPLTWVCGGLGILLAADVMLRLLR